MDALHSLLLTHEITLLLATHRYDTISDAYDAEAPGVDFDVVSAALDAERAAYARVLDTKRRISDRCPSSWQRNDGR